MLLFLHVLTLVNGFNQVSLQITDIRIEVYSSTAADWLCSAVDADDLIQVIVVIRLEILLGIAFALIG